MRCALVVTLLQVRAKEEDNRFKFVKPYEHRAALFLGSPRYLGFLVWTEDDYAVLRQIYVVPERRRRGYAASFLKFWVEHFADGIESRFGVEGPNRATSNLLIKLGYAHRNARRQACDKCFFVLGF